MIIASQGECYKRETELRLNRRIVQMAKNEPRKTRKSDTEPFRGPVSTLCL